MQYAVIALVILLALNFVKSILKPSTRQDKDDTKNFDYTQYKKSFLLTLNEKSCYQKIKAVTDKHGLWLFAKVRMLDVVAPTNKNYAYINKINKKHIDFVILNQKGYTICAIEIDDASHNKDSAKKNDNVKNQILSNVGIPLLRYYNTTIDKFELDLMPLIAPSK